MEITKNSLPSQTTQTGLESHGSARKVSFEPISLDSCKQSQGESKDFLDSIIQKNLRDFLAGQTAVNAAKAASAKSAIENPLPVNNSKVIEKGFTENRVGNPNHTLTSTRISTSTEDIDYDQVIWDTDSSQDVQDSDGDIFLGDAPDRLLCGATNQGGGSAQSTIVKHYGEDFQKQQSEEDICSQQIGKKDSGDSAEEGEIVTLKRAFSSSRNSISENTTDSTADTNSYRTSYSRAYTSSPFASDIYQKRCARRPASVCRLNIPRELLANLHRDPRFDQYCHAWISRPDFCGRGDECYYAHMYPPGTVEEFGIIAQDIDSNGAVFNGQDAGIEPRESRWSRYLLPGRQERTPGCYDRICKDFERNICRRGADCWYQHTTDPSAIRRRQGVVWKSRVDSKLETIANANGAFMRSPPRNYYPGQNKVFSNPNHYRSPIGRNRTSLSGYGGINHSYNRQDYFQTVPPLVKSRGEEAAIAGWREYAYQQERLKYLEQESQRRATESISTRSTTFAAKPIKSDVTNPKKSFFSMDKGGFGPCSEEGLLVGCDRDEPIGGRAHGRDSEETLISLL